ncbi:MAG: hypothetical protein JO069_04930 [Verrucomicrobia bacterium]|nr:hypothetical protein [Verrucomicrobiota bacterium]
MREQMQARLEALKAEWATGQAKLRELELQTLRLREGLLGLRGAIQVLEELLQPARPGAVMPQRGSTVPEGASGEGIVSKPVGQPGSEGGGPP